MSRIDAIPEGWEQLGSGWAICPEILRVDLIKATKCARGTYQEDLVTGYEAWSGSTLTGKAAQWGNKYAKSRTTLMNRMRKAGVVFSFVTLGKRNVLVLGNLPEPEPEQEPVPAPIDPEPDLGPLNTIADLFGAPA